MSLTLLPTISVEKVWGRDRLPQPFEAPAGKRIGEIWFEPPSELDQLLLKFLFTSAKLSVQVHPSEKTAQPGEDAKEECWLILDAEPSAQIAIGLTEETSEAELRGAAEDGSIEQLLQWHTVQAGDFFYLPAGTIHAIGGGLSIVEIQQNSDTTFRLYDYGRPRELHLDRAIEVASRGPYPRENARMVPDGSGCLVDGPFFRLDRVVGAPDEDIMDAYRGKLLVLPIEGAISGGGRTVEAGHCALVEDIGALDFSKARVTLLTRAS